VHDSSAGRDAADDGGLVLPSEPRSVALLRRYAVDRCLDMGWGEHSDIVALLVSEAAGNAVLHAYGPHVAVLVVEKGPRLRIEVQDGSRAVPLQRRAGERAEDGRGLLLIEAMSAAWGVDPQPAGKTVWFELDA
jgi:anti-sigma regulatory factor (Ser/Thr protein kinase)